MFLLPKMFALNQSMAGIMAVSALCNLLKRASLVEGLFEGSLNQKPFPLLCSDTAQQGINN